MFSIYTGNSLWSASMYIEDFHAVVLCCYRYMHASIVRTRNENLWLVVNNSQIFYFAHSFIGCVLYNN